MFARSNRSGLKQSRHCEHSGYEHRIHRLEIACLRRTHWGVAGRVPDECFHHPASAHNDDIAHLRDVDQPRHVFVRLESDDGFLRYLWAEIRVAGSPKMEGSLSNLDFSQPITVAYSSNATVLVVETAYAIGQTLESASGQRVLISEAENVPTTVLTNLIFVGVTKDAPLPGPGFLLIGGKNSRQVEDAGMEFILRYWKFAKDSAARRVGLARKDLPRGGDAAKLP